jgi:hypothetical protein
MSRQVVLTPRQKAFIPKFLATGNATASAIAAGFSERGASVAGTRMLRNASVQKALQARQAHDAARLSIKREDALAGLLEAIDQARVQSDPATMISGWREIARLQGYYQPRQVNVALSTDTQTTMARLATMSDAELVALIEAGSVA